MSNPTAPAGPPVIINTHTYTVGSSNDKKDPQKWLVRDNRTVKCHKQPAIITQKQIQGTAPGQPPFDMWPILCSLDCGKANIVEINGVPHWQQTCDPIGLSVRLQIAEEAANKDKEDKK